MAKKRLNPEEKLKKFSLFRYHKLEELKAGKITPFDFSDFTYNYFYQHKQKHEAKANDVYSVVFNYYYWLTQIERRAMKERKLISMNLGSEETFHKLSEMFIKRRDQMVRRLLDRLNYDIEEAYLVFGTTVELKIKGLPFTFYCKKNNLEKSDIEVIKIKKSENPAYQPLLDISLKISSI